MENSISWLNVFYPHISIILKNAALFSRILLHWNLANNNRCCALFHVKQFSTDVEFLWKKILFAQTFYSPFHCLFKNKNRGKNPGCLMFFSVKTDSPQLLVYYKFYFLSVKIRQKNKNLYKFLFFDIIKN